MGELRVGASVHGTEGSLGKVDAIVIDPTTRTVTHLVVAHEALGRRVLVPLSFVTSSTPDTIEVDLTEEAFHACELFDEPAFNVPDAAYTGDLGYEPGAYFLEPFASPLDGFNNPDLERIPKGEVTIRRGDEVYAKDGTRVGHVDELLVDPTDGHVTHVVLREGHVLRHDDDVVAPIGGAVIKEGRVILGLQVDELQELKRIKVKRHGHVSSKDLPPGT
jgi:sporulation protein YlmC with PRC-barrel domain